jgi:hypothetical protein
MVAGVKTFLVLSAWLLHWTSGLAQLPVAAVPANPPSPAASATPATGPLRIQQENARYFSDGNNKAVYLTGSHTWASLQDIGPTDPPAAFDFSAYLASLQRHHHNFIRLWRWELFQWTQREDQRRFYCTPHPWLRTGPGMALDGRPRFDLDKLDEAYFQRLRARTAAASARGI